MTSTSIFRVGCANELKQDRCTLRTQTPFIKFYKNSCNLQLLKRREGDHALRLGFHAALPHLIGKLEPELCRKKFIDSG